jgi:hypothetical protein
MTDEHIYGLNPDQHSVFDPIVYDVLSSAFDQIVLWKLSLASEVAWCRW